MVKLTRNGVVGMELTREEIADALGVVVGIERKAQCREVKQDVIDVLVEARNKLDEADMLITAILEVDD